MMRVLEGEISYSDPLAKGFCPAMWTHGIVLNGAALVPHPVRPRGRERVTSDVRPDAKPTPDIR
ncbi:hypothetical protein [Rubrivirga sp.]|uniref:hypothetical protein n=1 Tax=Rubrivirga sp. TaxID=1885344 RepID=UPI003C788DAD